MAISQKVDNDVQLPVIDVSHPNEQVASELVAAVATYGFVFVKGNGIDVTSSSVQATFEAARKFFSSPTDEKKTCPMQLDNKGWTSMNEEVLDPATDKVIAYYEHVKKAMTDPRKARRSQGVGILYLAGDITIEHFIDSRRAFNFGEFENGKATQPLPPSFEQSEAHLAEFYGQCRALCMRLLKLFALGLKVDLDEGGEEWFSSRHDAAAGPSGTILRLLHYPPTPRQSGPSLRAGAHSDYGSLTLLFRLPNQSGLEILTPSGSWATVPVSPPSTETDSMPPVLVNVGDLLSFWTGGLFKSTVHRVVFDGDGEGKERYSIAFFCHPARDTQLVSVPSDKVREQVKEKGIADKVGYGALEEGRALTAEEHLQGRLRATYGWGKEEKEITAT